MGADSSYDRAVEWIRDFFHADLTRLLLSTLIILSVLPFGWVERYSLVFFGVFAIELGLRVMLLRAELRQRSLNRAEMIILALDVIATLSFLPLDTVVDTRFLRLVRLSRMLMLLSYWRPVVREVWFIIVKRERRYQLIFVASLVLILAFCSAVFLWHFPAGIDYNGDGKPDNENFWTMFWWSLRQIEDPGNLLADPAPTLVFAFSVILTISGLFVIAFFIGIGASVVEELVQVGRKRRIGVRGHSVVANVGPHARVLVEELVSYYAKTFRTPRLVTMGPSADRPDYLYGERLRAVPYRPGKPLSEHDLALVDADRAIRVILLGDRGRATSDSTVISQVLSVRERNPDCWIYAELFRHDNVAAVVRAGGCRTVPLLARRFVSLLIADLLVSPGLDRVYEQLLTSRGNEIYTCVFGFGHLSHVAAPSAQLAGFERLLLGGRRSHGVTLLGYLVVDDGRPSGFAHVIGPGAVAGAPSEAPVDRLCGFFGVASNFDRLKTLCLDLPDLASGGEAADGPEDRLVEGMVLQPTQRPVGEVLVCGYHAGLAELCCQVLLFSPQATIHVLVPDEAGARDLAATFVGLSDVVGRWPGGSVFSFVEISPGQLACRVGQPEDVSASDGGAAGPEAPGRIDISAGDWSDERVLLGQPGGRCRLSGVDAVVLTHTKGDEDPDARSALALLKLLHLCEEKHSAIKEDLRIVCAVRSGEMADLFERRFTAPAADRRCSVTILATDRLRHSFIAQGVLVPGIAAIYDELLSKPGGQIFQLGVAVGGGDADRELTFDGLLAALYRQRGLILIAVELDRVVVNPRPRDRGYRFRAGALQSIFVVGRPESDRR